MSAQLDFSKWLDSIRLNSQSSQDSFFQVKAVELLEQLFSLVQTVETEEVDQQISYKKMTTLLFLPQFEKRLLARSEKEIFLGSGLMTSAAIVATAQQTFQKFLLTQSLTLTSSEQEALALEIESLFPSSEP